MKKNIVLITIALLSVLLIVSCSNKTHESKAVGLSIGRVETVFADDAWNYDVVYKSGSTRYISEVVVNLSNGTYRYPSSVKAEILKKDGETWKSISKDVTDKFTFSDSGVYKIKYTAEGMTAETGEFNVYKPGDIVDFYATKKAYVEGFQMQRKDFSCTYCYKDKNGNIGITNSSDKAWVSYYTRSADYTSFITILNYDDKSTPDNYQYGEEVMAGVVVQIPDTEIYSIQEVPITVVKEESCDSSIKNLAYFTKPNKSANYYELSGSIIKALYYDGSSVGKIDLVKKTEVGEEVGVKIAEGYTVKISDFIASKAPKSDTAAIQELYDGVTTWNPVNSGTFADKSTSEITGAGYYMIQIWKGSDEITKDDPAFIRISK